MYFQHLLLPFAFAICRLRIVYRRRNTLTTPILSRNSPANPLLSSAFLALCRKSSLVFPIVSMQILMYASYYEDWQEPPWRHNPHFLTWDQVSEGLMSRQITLLVGPEKKELKALEGHLCHIKFFEAALRGGFQEATSGTIEMPEDDPAAVSDLLVWILRGFSEDEWYNIDLSCEPAETSVIRLVPLAEKLCIPQLATQCYHQIWNAIVRDMEFLPNEELLPYYKHLREYRARFLVVHFVVVAQLYGDLPGVLNFDLEAQMLVNIDDHQFWQDYAGYKLLWQLATKGCGEASCMSSLRVIIVRLLNGTLTRDDFSQTQFMDESETEKEANKEKFRQWFHRLLDL